MPHKNQALAGLLLFRETWTLSLGGKFILLLTAAVVVFCCLRRLYPFLAITDRVPSDVLVDMSVPVP